MKGIKLLGIFTAAFMLAGCSADDADLSEETPQDAAEVYSVEEETNSQEAEPEDNNVTLTETEAEYNIRKADQTIQMIMEKPKIFFAEETLNEEEVKAYLSNYFDPGILDYVFFVYRIEIEDGKCFSQYNNRYSDRYPIFIWIPKRI